MDDRVNARARAEGGVISRTEALDRGVTERQLRRALAAGRLVRLTPGLYAAPTTPDSVALRHWAALKKAGATGALRGHSAAWLWGLDGFAAPYEPEVTVADTVQRSANGRAWRRARPAVMKRVVVRRGMRVLSLEDTVRELAVELSPDDLEALVIELVNRSRRTTAGRLLSACGRGLPGSTALRAAVAATGDRVLSLWERKLLRLLRQAGVPVIANYPVVDRKGRRRYLDLAIPSARLVIEVDGFGVHTRRERFYDDRRRKRALVLQMGWQVVEVTPQDIRDRPDEIVRDVLAFLASAS